MYASLAITSLMWSLDLSQRGDSLTMSAATSYLIRYSLEPLVPARSSISLSECLSPSRRRLPRPSCDRPYTSRRLEDLALLSRALVLLSLWAAIADGSPASRRPSSASLRPLSCARLSYPYLYGHKLATVDFLTLRHGAIFSPPVPPACPDSAYIHPGFT